MYILFFPLGAPVCWLSVCQDVDDGYSNDTVVGTTGNLLWNSNSSHHKNIILFFFNIIYRAG